MVSSISVARKAPRMPPLWGGGLAVVPFDLYMAMSRKSSVGQCHKPLRAISVAIAITGKLFLGDRGGGSPKVRVWVLVKLDVVDRVSSSPPGIFNEGWLCHLSPAAKRQVSNQPISRLLSRRPDQESHFEGGNKHWMLYVARADLTAVRSIICLGIGWPASNTTKKWPTCWFQSRGSMPRGLLWVILSRTFPLSIAYSMNRQSK